MMTQKYLKDVTTLSLDAEKCIGCGRCAEVCPHGVFDIADRKAQAGRGANSAPLLAHAARITDKDLCMECGACALNCPSNAIEVHAGVGCAAAIIQSWFTGKEPTCGCSNDGDGDSCCC